MIIDVGQKPGMFWLLEELSEFTEALAGFPQEYQQGALIPSSLFPWQTHSMDFDDTWHPATHPSGAVLPALLAASQMLPQNTKPSGLDFLLAFNVGLEVQGRLMHFSTEAHDIPKR